jgi:hypothetical protein
MFSIIYIYIERERAYQMRILILYENDKNKSKPLNKNARLRLEHNTVHLFLLQYILPIRLFHSSPLPVTFHGSLHAATSFSDAATTSSSTIQSFLTSSHICSLSTLPLLFSLCVLQINSVISSSKTICALDLKLLF